MYPTKDGAFLVGILKLYFGTSCCVEGSVDVSSVFVFLGAILKFRCGVLWLSSGAVLFFVGVKLRPISASKLIHT